MTQLWAAIGMRSEGGGDGGGGGEACLQVLTLSREGGTGEDERGEGWWVGVSFLTSFSP